MKLNKKGYSLQELSPLAITFVVAAIVMGFGAKVLSDMATDFNEGNANTSTAWAITQNGTEAVNTIGKYLPTLALIIVAALIIGVVISAFYFGRN